MKTKNKSGYIIKVSEQALIQMCLNGFEAYCVRHRLGTGQSTKLETFGLLWGHETTLPNDKTLYSVEMVSIDTSAEMGKANCMPKDEALELKRDLMSSYWPQYEFLGDFHTHPWNHYGEVIEDKRYRFSEEDFDSIEGRSAFWEAHNYRVGLVLTISTLEHSCKLKSKDRNNSTLDFTFNNYRLYLRGYVAWKGEKGIEINRTSRGVILDCPSLSGLKWEHSDFGRFAGSNSRGKHSTGDI